ncbi:hypothetical protein RRG08_058743 [Elysia crispata]|uniref:Uncharacterized protein n=1 Tax=Elysia crispata TaxID=231223 RepID=A0AAE1D6R4_9GAST|nr:hypothetical protein RRG08_058743 [Elysia crispata]
MFFPNPPENKFDPILAWDLSRDPLDRQVRPANPSTQELIELQICDCYVWNLCRCLSSSQSSLPYNIFSVMVRVESLSMPVFKSIIAFLRHILSGGFQVYRTTDLKGRSGETLLSNSCDLLILTDQNKIVGKYLIPGRPFSPRQWQTRVAAPQFPTGWRVACTISQSGVILHPSASSTEQEPVLATTHRLLRHTGDLFSQQYDGAMTADGMIYSSISVIKVLGKSWIFLKELSKPHSLDQENGRRWLIITEVKNEKLLESSVSGVFGQTRYYVRCSKPVAVQTTYGGRCVQAPGRIACPDNNSPIGCPLEENPSSDRTPSSYIFFGKNSRHSKKSRNIIIR